MQLSDLKSASTFAQQYGVKSVVYGAPGSGKTPIVMTAPRPVLCVIEPGMLTMKNANNIPCFEANTPKLIDEFFTWVLFSPEAKSFDTVCIDSASQLAGLFLKEELNVKNNGKKVHGQQAYGNMAERVFPLLEALYYLKEKHIYLIAKQAVVDENGTTTKRPYFPGKVLNTEIPHLYDEIFHVAKVQIPSQPLPVPMFRTREIYGIEAPRDRSGKLDEFEPTNLTHVFNKCMS